MSWGLLISTMGFSATAARRFDIGMWCGIPHEYLSQARMYQIGAAGFSLSATPCNEPNNITYNQRALQFANKTGFH